MTKRLLNVKLDYIFSKMYIIKKLIYLLVYFLYYLIIMAVIDINIHNNNNFINENNRIRENITKISNYKIYIANKLKFSICGVSYNKSIHFNELYNSHKILFKHNKLQLSRTCIDDISQEFTVQHFIYYIIKEIVKVVKRNSKHFTDYDIIDLLSTNMKNGYQLHIDDIGNKLYDFLYPHANLKDISLIFMIIRDIFDDIDVYDLIRFSMIEYFDFLEWSEYDLIYKLDDCIQEVTNITTPMSKVFDAYAEYLNTGHFDESLNNEDLHFNTIHLIYYIILENIKVNRYTLEEVISLITSYKQIRCQNRVNVYDEELIMKTWHPTRLMDWCLDIEEINDFEMIE